MPGLTRNLLTLPWGYVGPHRVVEEGEEHWEIRIRELPEFFVAGATRDEALNELRPALRAFLESYVDRGETPPVPEDINRWKVELLQVQRGAVADAVVEGPSNNPGKTVGASEAGLLVTTP